LRFCSDKCYQAGAIRAAGHQLAAEVPEDLVQRRLVDVHQGECPKCGRPGPIDVHVSHRVWSAIHLTSWKSRPQLSCRTCGVKAQLADTMFSLAFGWWGVPFGLILTPVQVGRNIAGMFFGPNSAKPSPALERIVRHDIAHRAAMIQATVDSEEKARASQGSAVDGS
jgi:hypothetical protein